MYKNILNEALLSDKPSENIYKLIESGSMEKIMPELLKLKGFDQKTPYHDKDVLQHTLAVVDSIEGRLTLRMAALLHDICKPDSFTTDDSGRGHFYGHHIVSACESEKILKRLGYDDNFIKEVCILIRNHYIKDIANAVKDNKVKEFVNSVGRHRIEDLIKLLEADMKGKPDNKNNSNIIEMLKSFI